ncbi:MbtH family protein [Burkholderia plantarii]|nr:MbtH family protein [Burkholderia plantarii]ALK32481.1 putative MbtH-like protein [Burkholderia plantarii]GLZ19034.1 protein mbtH [Burkholderia plantarii]
MPNPFDNDAAEFTVLRNAEGQHSLWPAFAAQPAGWDRRHGPASRADCLRFVETHWTDIRPLSGQRDAAGATARGDNPRSR